MRAAACCLVLLTGCAALPEDHLLHSQVPRAFRALRERVDPHRLATGVAQRAVRLQRSVEQVQPLDPRRLARATRQIRADVARTGQRAVRGLSRLPTEVSTTVDRERRRARNLVAEKGHARQLLAPDRIARRARKAWASAPLLLDLHHRGLPSSTDPNRQTSIDASQRRETWAERVLHLFR